MENYDALVILWNNICNFFIDKEVANVASVFGIAISVIGFGLTLLGVWKSKAAAQAASEASSETRATLQQFELISDFSTAIPMLEEIKRLHREQAWHPLPDRYANLRKTLISLRHKHPNLSDEHKTAIQNAITHLSELEKKIDSAIEKNIDIKEIPKMNSIVSRQVDSLHQMLLEIRDRQEQ